MKHILLYALAASLSVAPLFAQQPSTGQRVDSLVALLPNLPDSARLATLNMVLHLTKGLPEELTYMKMYREEARRQKNVAQESVALLLLTSLYYTQFDSDSVFIFGEKAIRFAREHGIYADMAFAQRQLIRRNQAEGRSLTALNIAQDAYEEAKANNHRPSMAILLAAMGDICSDLRQFEHTIRYYTESTEAAMEDRDRTSLLILNNFYFLGLAHKYVENWAEILRFADSMHVEVARMQEFHPNYNFDTYRFREMALRSVALAGLGLPQQALQALRKAEDLFNPEWPNELFLTTFDDMWGSYYMATGNYNRAIEHLGRLLAHFEKVGSQLDIHFTKQRVAQAYYAKGDFKATADLQKRIIVVKDSLNKEQFYSQMSELRTLYQLDQAEFEAERRQHLLRRQRMMITGLVLACWALLVIIGLIMWNRRKITAKNRGLYRQIKERDRITEDWQRTATDDRNQDMVARLHQHLISERRFAQQEIDVNELALNLVTNRTSLFNAVKTSTGKTLQEYINSVRITEARRLLETSSESIDDIVDLCGFASKRTFYRLFRESCDMPPAEYRRIARGI